MKTLFSLFALGALVCTQGFSQFETPANAVTIRDGVGCAVTVRSGQTAWDVQGSFASRIVGNLLDSSAQWISPLPTQQNPNGPFCPYIGANQRMVLKSQFTVASSEHHFVEFLADDKGTISILPSGSTLPVARIAVKDFGYARQSFIFPPGAYTIYIEVQDQWPIATSAAVSITNSLGQVVKRTTADGTWQGWIEEVL